MTQVIHVTDADFDSAVVQSELPVLLDFWAPWCGPCRAIGPILDELSQDFNGKAVIAKMNVDENQEVPAKFGVRSIPTLVVFKNGEAVKTVIGGQPKSALSELLNQYL